MADWYDLAVSVLLQLAKTNPNLERAIRLAVKKIEKDPSIGRYVRDTRYTFTDPDNRFRIGYNYHPQGQAIEIVVINVLYLF